MELTPREKDKLLLYTAALVAERRLARGVKLNYPETVAYISMHIMEGARDGRSVARDRSRSGATCSFVKYRRTYISYATTWRY